MYSNPSKSAPLDNRHHHNPNPRGGGGRPRPPRREDNQRTERTADHHHHPHEGDQNKKESNNPIPPQTQNPNPKSADSGTSLRARSSSSLSQQTCLLCYHDIKFYSVGSCEHTICYKCSSRMRVLLEQNECPICRQTLEKVIFTEKAVTYKKLNDILKFYIYIPKYGIYIETEEIKFHFDQLLQNKCQFCEEMFANFKTLRAHIGKFHDLYPCDLCVDHIKHFPCERKYYNRQDLAYHKRKGDLNDTSHRGHPLCKFCERRYFDSDELFKHLRVDHFYCHFCDADGLNHFYDTYNELRVHFRCEHFLCEEEDCVNETFTNVFRTEIDLKAHLTQTHSKLLGKHGAKQIRKLDVDFLVAPKREDDKNRRTHYRDRQGGGGAGSGGPRNRDREEVEQVERFMEHEYETEALQAKPNINTSSSTDFPSLVQGEVGAGAQGQPTLQALQAYTTKQNAKPHKTTWNNKVTGSSKHDEDFPALSNPDMDPGGSINLPTKYGPPPKQVFKPPRVQSEIEQFPELPASSKPKFKVKSVWNSKQPKKPLSAMGAAPVQPKKPVTINNNDFNFVPLLPTNKKDRKKFNNNLDSLEDEFPNLALDDDFYVKPKTKVSNGASKSSKPKSQKSTFPKPDDFPSLTSSSSSSKNNPPPGFSIPPPPGFTTLAAAAASSSSAAQNFDIDEMFLPSASGSTQKFTYTKPIKFQERNKSLMESITKHLTKNDIDVFKYKSNQYKNSELNGKEYYDVCKEKFPSEMFRELFNELICLLPNIKRQQDLLIAHRIIQGSMDGLESCHICHQVVASYEFHTSHIQIHD